MAGDDPAKSSREHDDGEHDDGEREHERTRR
jgi:hypothetical protein